MTLFVFPPAKKFVFFCDCGVIPIRFRPRPRRPFRKILIRMRFFHSRNIGTDPARDLIICRTIVKCKGAIHLGIILLTLLLSLSLLLLALAALGGGLGWFFGNSMQLWSKRPFRSGRLFLGALNRAGMVNGWKIMECSIGALGGFGALFGFWLAYRKAPAAAASFEPLLAPFSSAAVAAAAFFSAMAFCAALNFSFSSGVGMGSMAFFGQALAHMVQLRHLV